MDWLHIGELIGGLAAAGWGGFQKAKAKRAEAAKKAIVEAAFKELEEAAGEMMGTFRDSLAKMDSKVGGAALLTELSIKHERAIAKGKAAAVKAYEESLKKPRE